MRLRLMGTAGLPAMWATAIMPSRVATCASCGVPATNSPLAEKPGPPGLLPLVDLDEAAVELDARVLQADVFGVGLAADGYQQLLCFEGFLLAVLGGEREPHAGAGLFDIFRARAGFDANALLAEVSFELLGDVFVLHRNHARQHFDHGDFGAEAAEDAGELHAHGAGADDDEALRHRREIEDFDVGENEFRVGREAGDH